MPQANAEQPLRYIKIFACGKEGETRPLNKSLKEPKGGFLLVGKKGDRHKQIAGSAFCLAGKRMVYAKLIDEVFFQHYDLFKHGLVCFVCFFQFGGNCPVFFFKFMEFFFVAVYGRIP